MSKEIDEIEILRLFALSSEPVLTTSEVMDRFDISQQAAYYRLRNLEADDYLESKKIGAKARVFWLTAKGKRQVSDAMK